MKAVWVIDYDYRKDKCYNAPGCPECREPIGMYEDGKYHCFSCGEEVEVTDSEMIEWLNIREETKTEYRDCPKITTIDGKHTSGCGGEKCVETHRALEIRQRMVERQEELRYKQNRSEAEKAEYCALIALQF